MKIRLGDFENAKVLALLRLHVEGMHASSPPGTCQALDVSGLRHPSISFFTAWDEGELLGIGAIKELSAQVGEIKSMRTDPGHLRKGVGEALLRHLLSVAKTRAYRLVSLETGTGPEFDAALALYRRHDFQKGQAFGEYEETEFNQFFHLDLDGG